MRKVARQQDGTTRCKRLTKDELQEAEEKNALTRLFEPKPGPALIEPDPAATVSGSAKKVCRIVQTPAWLRSKGRKETTRKRMAEAAAKEATRKRQAEPAAKEATRKRKAEPAAKETTRKRMAEAAAKEASRKRMSEPPGGSEV